jgi:Arc/MetJ-type ribon-helix-helix transcriptional regulator
VTRKPRVVTFRLDQATWDFMREIVPYTRYRNTSSFIRAAHPYLPQSQTLRIIFATACQETFFSSLLVLLSQKVATNDEENHLFGKIHTSAMGGWNGSAKIE